jgi:hypothetical protein
VTGVIHGGACRDDLLENAPASERIGLLGEIADDGAFDDIDTPGVGLLEPGDHLEERGLSGAVRSDDRDTIASADAKVCALEQAAAAEFTAKTGDRDHGVRVARSTQSGG